MTNAERIHKELSELLEKWRKEREEMPYFLLITTSGKEIKIQQQPEGFYSTSDTFYKDENGKLFKTYPGENKVYKCTESGEADTFVGMIKEG